MQSLRPLLFWIHLTAGVCAGIVILIMSFTGAVLALKPQIQNRVDRDIRIVRPEAARLTPFALLHGVKAQRPDAAPQSLAFDRDPTIAATVGLGPEGNVYVNPYTGEILGRPSVPLVRFFQTMTSWHRYLGATGEYRNAGRWLTGACNLAFLVMGLTGLILWWPKQLSARHLRPIVWFTKTSTTRARDFNWHNTFGFWCLPAIIVMTASAIVISYTWGTNLVYRLTGSPIPVARSAAPPATAAPVAPGGRGTAPEPDTQSQRQTGPVVPASLNLLVSTAERHLPTWGQLSLRLPNREDGPVAFTLTDGEHWNAFARSQLTLNGATGEVVQWAPYEQQNLGQKARGWLRFAHTGELGGLPGQIAAGVGSLGGVFLVYTGLSLAFRRLVNWSLWARLGARSAGTIGPDLEPLSGAARASRSSAISEPPSRWADARGDGTA